MFAGMKGQPVSRSQDFQGFPAWPKPEVIPAERLKTFGKEEMRSVGSALLFISRILPLARVWPGRRELSQGIFWFRAGCNCSSSPSHQQHSKPRFWLGYGSRKESQCSNRLCSLQDVANPCTVQGIAWEEGEDFGGTRR